MKQFDIFRKNLADIEADIARLRAKLDQAEGSILGAISQSATSLRDPMVSSTDLDSQTNEQTVAKVNTELFLSATENSVVIAVARLGQIWPIKAPLFLAAALAGFHPSYKGFLRAVDSLSASGRLSVGKDVVTLTSEGKVLLTEPPPKLSSDELASSICAQLPSEQRDIFSFLFDANGRSLTKQALATHCGKGKDDKVFSKSLLSLHQLGLISRTATNEYACAELIYIDS